MGWQCLCEFRVCSKPTQLWISVDLLFLNHFPLRLLACWAACPALCGSPHWPQNLNTAVWTCPCRLPVCPLRPSWPGTMLVLHVESLFLLCGLSSVAAVVFVLFSRSSVPSPEWDLTCPGVCAQPDCSGFIALPRACFLLLFRLVGDCHAQLVRPYFPHPGSNFCPLHWNAVFFKLIN